MKNRFHFFVVLFFFFLNPVSHAIIPVQPGNNPDSPPAEIRAEETPANQHLNETKTQDDSSTPGSANREEAQPSDALLQQCAICDETLNDDDQSIELGCKNHTYCKNCLREYFQSKLTEGAYQIKCPEPECKTILSIPDFADQKLAEANKKGEEQKLIKQTSSRRYLNTEFLKGCFSALFCCCNCFGLLSWSDVEVCPNCKEIFEFTGGCPAVYHNKCDRVFQKNNQITIPCGVVACGCYTPQCIGCCNYAEVNGQRRYCNSCISCWYLKI